MPAKKVAKVAEVVAEVVQREASPEDCNLPVPLNIDNASVEGMNALMPWLAMGYGPVKTSGTDDECGIRALWRSFKDARDELRSDRDPKIRHATQNDFRNLMKSAAYIKKINEIMQSAAYNDLPEDERVVLREGLLQTRNISTEQITQLLELANEKYGTNFQVGFIIQGWRCQFDKETRKWKHEFVKDTAIQVHTCGPSASLRAGDRLTPAPPIIWLWHDDTALREQQRDNGDLEFLNHWEAFGLGGPARPGRGHTGPDDDHRQRVEDWKLGRRVREDQKKGVWIVTKNSRTADGKPDDTKDYRYLDVLAGHFVRDVNSPVFWQRPDCRYVQACNGIDKGNVPEANLKKIELHDSAPSEGPDNDDEKEKSPDLKPAKTEVETLETEADDKDKDKEKPKPPNPKQPKIEEKPDVKTNTKIQPAKTSRSKKIPFRIYRVVQATDKVGGEAKNVDFDIDDFQVENGEFLLYLDDRGLDGTPWVKKITNIGGAVGQVRTRRLQLLVAPPWGIPASITVISNTEINAQSTLAELQTAARLRELSAGGAHDELLTAIQKSDDVGMLRLPLARLEKAYSAEDAKGNTSFLEGEIVREVQGSRKANTTEVMDYQGNTGTVKTTDLDRSVGPPNSIFTGVPFGLRISLGGMPECAGDRPELAALVKKNPEIKEEGVDAGIFGRSRANLKRHLITAESVRPKDAGKTVSCPNFCEDKATNL